MIKFEKERRSREEFRKKLSHALDTFVVDDPYKSYRARGAFERRAATTLKSVVTNLNAYADRLLTLATENRFKGSRTMPQAYAARAILDQIGRDLEVILRALQQRLPPLASDGDEIVTRLQMADNLAYAALQPALDAGLVEPAAPVSYFQKSNSIRVIPYARVALVGVPFSAIALTNDMLAIPHEVGHYIFWHAPLTRASLSGSLLRHVQGLPSWIQAWTEEIFSDIYGCLVAGPLMAVSAQDMFSGVPIEYFIRDDGEHPVSAARAYIFASVLDTVGMPKLAKAFADEWEQSIGEIYGLRPNDPVTVGDGVRVPLDVVREDLDTVVRRIIGVDLFHMMRPAAQSWSWGDKADADVVVKETLETDFDAYVQQLLAAERPLPYLDTNIDGKEIRLENARQLTSVPLGSTGYPMLDELIARLEDEAEIAPALWSLLISSGGWTTGPGDGPPTGGKLFV
ncbi:MAG: hypothetical protein H3C34_15370 [Caldilineaceae bacterium]|nr:hypothetical protein [Caldilineaceae bacterium]